MQFITTHSHILHISSSFVIKWMYILVIHFLSCENYLVVVCSFDFTGTVAAPYS